MPMIRVLRWLLVAQVVTGCASFARYPAAPKAEHPLLVVEGRRWNEPLVNATPPEYGLNAGGGCISQSEFHVAIERLAYDTTTGRLRVEGRLVNPTYAVFAALIWKEAGVTRRAPASTTESFSLSLDLQATPILTFYGLGHRTLEVDLRILSRRAARVGPSIPSA